MRWERGERKGIGGEGRGNGREREVELPHIFNPTLTTYRPPTFKNLASSRCCG